MASSFRFRSSAAARRSSAPFSLAFHSAAHSLDISSRKDHRAIDGSERVVGSGAEDTGSVSWDVDTDEASGGVGKGGEMAAGR